MISCWIFILSQNIVIAVPLCPILLNLGRMEGEEDTDDEDVVQVLVVDEESARIH
jgi:hypothetical protein